MKRRPTFPAFEVGQRVRLLKDIRRWPLMMVDGVCEYGEPYVLVPAGSIGTINARQAGNQYVVSFEQVGTLMVFAGALEAVEAESETAS